MIKRHLDNYEIIIFLQKYIRYDCRIEWEDFKFCYFNPKLFKPFFSFEIIILRKLMNVYKVVYIHYLHL